MPGSGGGDDGGLAVSLWSAGVGGSAGGGVGEEDGLGEEDGKVIFISLMLGTGAGWSVGRLGCGG